MVDPWLLCLSLYSSSSVESFNKQRNYRTPRNSHNLPSFYSALCFGLWCFIQSALFLLGHSLTEAYFVEVYLGNFRVKHSFFVGLTRGIQSLQSLCCLALYAVKCCKVYSCSFSFCGRFLSKTVEVTILEKTSFLVPPILQGLFLETRILISKLNKI